MMDAELHKCNKPDCDRQTTAEFCCAPCATAAKGKYEIDKHSPGCNSRHYERKKSAEPAKKSRK